MTGAMAGSVRFAKRKVKVAGLVDRGCLHVGFVPTLDCALLVAAQELGLFHKHGLSVRLSREVGWATIREKLLHEELDAAGAHASMAFSIYCGISVVRRSCLTGLLLGLNASAITLSNNLWNEGVRDARSLKEHIDRLAGRRVLNFGVVLELSSQNHHLRAWLRAGGIDPDRDVRITVVPSVLVYDSFKAGYLDGYCVAEPWNSAATLNGDGWVVAVTSEVEQGVPEKVLLVLQEFAENREEEHLHLIAALIEASRFCDQPGNRPALARMLAARRYFDVPEEQLMNSLVGPFETGRGQRRIPDFATFDALKSGAPTRAMGRKTLDLVRALGPREVCPALRPEVVGRVFRHQIYEKALALTGGAVAPATTRVMPDAESDGAEEDLARPSSSHSGLTQSARPGGDPFPVDVAVLDA